MNATLPAMPTFYKGRIYRSELEARWAAFFDILGEPYEYEPMRSMHLRQERRYEGWSPTFFLKCLRNLPTVSVAVRHIAAWDRLVAREMADASRDPGSRLLLLGNSPDFSIETTQIGSYAETGVYEASWTECLIGTSAAAQHDLFPNGHEFSRKPILGKARGTMRFRSFEPEWIAAGKASQRAVK